MVIIIRNFKILMSPIKIVVLVSCYSICHTPSHSPLHKKASFRNVYHSVFCHVAVLLKKAWNCQIAWQMPFLWTLSMATAAIVALAAITSEFCSIIAVFYFTHRSRALLFNGVAQLTEKWGNLLPVKQHTGTTRRKTSKNLNVKSQWSVIWIFMRMKTSELY